MSKQRLSAVEGYLPVLLQGEPSEVQERADPQALERPPLRLCNGKTDRQWLRALAVCGSHWNKLSKGKGELQQPPPQQQTDGAEATFQQRCCQWASSALRALVISTWASVPGRGGERTPVGTLLAIWYHIRSKLCCGKRVFFLHLTYNLRIFTMLA